MFGFTKKSSQEASVSSNEGGSSVKKGVVHEEIATGLVHDGFVPPTDKELRRLMLKIDLRVIPYIAILYLCSFLDRVNIGRKPIVTTYNISILVRENRHLYMHLYYVFCYYYF